MAAQDLAPDIGSAGQNPQHAQADGLSVQSHPLPALIAADRYLAAKAARSTANRGVMFSKMHPAGAFPDAQGTGLGGINFDQPGVGNLF